MTLIVAVKAQREASATATAALVKGLRLTLQKFVEESIKPLEYHLYAQYGDVSPKVDVYDFGVVLYELISAKEVIVKASESVTESMGLVALFEEALSQHDPKEDLQKLVDPRLGDNCPIDSIHKCGDLMIEHFQKILH